MKVICFFLILNFLYSIKSIVNGVYNFQTNKNEFLIFENNKLKIGNSKMCEKKSNFRIMKHSNSFYIEYALLNLRLSVVEGDEIIFLNKNNKNSKKLYDWSFIELNNKKYILRNDKSKCYIISKNKKILCEENKINKAIKFNLIKIS